MNDLFSSAAGDDAGETFDPVPVRARHDGWTPERQHDFIQALGESGCVAEACAAVGMSAASAYKLRARPDASVFRQAWDVALDYAIRRLGDAAISRALHGVSRPVFYQGEQIGERRHYDEKLTMFLLRYRDPVRYGAWNDAMEARRHPDGAGMVFAHALNSVLDHAHGIEPEPLPHDPDSHLPPDEVAPRMPRAIAAGPAPAERPHAADYDGPEELRHVFETIRARANALRNAAIDNDPTADDWNQALTVRRYRRNSEFNGL